MKSFRSWAVAAVLLLVAPPATVAGQAPPVLAIRTVRFWVPEYGQTVVKAFVQIPYVALSPTDAGPGGTLNYRVSVRVADSSGLTLMQQAWNKQVPALMRVAGASGLEILEFPVAPGHYRLELTVEDSASGNKLERTVDFEGFGAGPGASDLVISPQMRIAGAEDSVPVAGELRRGNTIFTATAEVRLSPVGDRARLFYYLEAYSERADTGALTLEIRDPAGAPVLQLPVRPVQLGVGGGVIRGQLDLTGLPSGAYEVRTVLTLGTEALIRTAPFTMGDLEAALARENAARAQRLESDEGYFGEMTEAQLDAAFAPLLHIATGEDRLSVWSPQLSVNGKRQFLLGFWRNRDQTLGTPKNEAREAFYALIAQADERFTDQQQNSRPGWRTDMGRILIRNGEPTEILRRSQIGLSAPYQVWRYAAARERWYVFLDRTNFGGYELMGSNDPREPSRADWERQIGPDGMNDIGSFLNIDFFQRGRARTQ